MFTLTFENGVVCSSPFYVRTVDEAREWALDASDGCEYPAVLTDEYGDEIEPKEVEWTGAIDSLLAAATGEVYWSEES